MRKSLILIASALLIAVGAAGTQRLRYDSTIFGSRGEVTETRRPVRDYPPCVRGVREDRCIQLYERGVRRSYQRWLVEHGLAGRDRHAAATRAYPPCRSRSDDRCQQRSVRRAVRTAHARAPGRTVRHAHHRLVRARHATAQRAAAHRRAAHRAASPARVTSVRRTAPALRATATTPARPAAPRPVAPRPAPRQQQPANTPGI